MVPIIAPTPKHRRRKNKHVRIAKKNWAVVAYYFTPVVNSSAEKYCMHMGIAVKILTDCLKITLPVQSAHMYM